MGNKKSIVSILIIIIVAIISAVSLYASFAWYIPNAPSGYVFDLIADSVYSIYFSSSEVDIDGELKPAVAMPGAVAEGKYFDVKKLYDENDPENERSYVSEIAETISYSTTFISRGADTILVEYEWYITFSTDPAVRLDKDEFVFDVSFFDVERESAIIPDSDNRFYLEPVGETRTVEISVDIEMYFAKVDELMDPRFKDSVFWVTVDIRRIWEIGTNGYMEISFDTNSSEVDGLFYPEEDPIYFESHFSHTGGVSYLADIDWYIMQGGFEVPDYGLYSISVKFFNKANQQEIVPNIDGKINLPANSNIRVEVELGFVYDLDYMLTNHPSVVGQVHSMTIAIGTAP